MRIIALLAVVSFCGCGDDDGLVVHPNGEYAQLVDINAPFTNTTTYSQILVPADVVAADVTVTWSNGAFSGDCVVESNPPGSASEYGCRAWIPLQMGTNQIWFHARRANGQFGNDFITVDRIP